MANAIKAPKAFLLLPNQTIEIIALQNNLERNQKCVVEINGIFNGYMWENLDELSNHVGKRIGDSIFIENCNQTNFIWESKVYKEITLNFIKRPESSQIKIIAFNESHKFDLFSSEISEYPLIFKHAESFPIGFLVDYLPKLFYLFSLTFIFCWALIAIDKFFLQNNTILKNQFGKLIIIVNDNQNFYQIIYTVFLLLYIALGLYTQLRLMNILPFDHYLLNDFNVYKNALGKALVGRNPYDIKRIGDAFLYPPPALLIVEIFSYIKDFFVLASVYQTINIFLLLLIVFGIQKKYGFSIRQVWWLYVICIFSGPFLEVLYIGQINVFTLFGLFLLFIFQDTSPIISGIGLGLAVITKVTPAVFFGYLVIAKKNKTVIVSIITIAILFVISTLRYGVTPIFNYYDAFINLINEFPISVNSQSLVAKLAVADLAEFPEIISLLPKILITPIEFLFRVFTREYESIQKFLMIYIVITFVISGLITYLKNLPREPFFIVTALGMMLSPNVMWYHHYVFILLPILILMAFSKLDKRIILFCMVVLITIQFDRHLPPYGLLIHIFSHILLLSMLLWQIYNAFNKKNIIK